MLKKNTEFPVREQFKPDINEFDPSPPVARIAALKVHDIREKQRQEGNFDCFGRACSGFCDQPACLYYAECMEASRAMAGLELS